jgi:cytosine/adenosine deaminase-related metal-dependent hydrolase
MLPLLKSRVARSTACAFLALSFAVSVFAYPIDEPVESSNTSSFSSSGSHLAAAATKNGSSILLKGATIIAYDDKKNELDIIRGGSLLIINDRIADVGMKLSTSIPEGTEVVDLTGSIITPGFVDTHKHSWQHLYQTMGANVVLGEYFYKFSGISKITTQISADDSYISTLMSLADSLNGGVTSVLDHAHGTFSPKHSDAMLKAQIDSGARVWNAYSIVPIASTEGGKFHLDWTGQEPGGWKWKQLEQLAKNAPWADGRVQLGLGWEMGREDAEVKYGFDKAS